MRTGRPSLAKGLHELHGNPSVGASTTSRRYNLWTALDHLRCASTPRRE
jgi:hypothetical protein